MDELVRILTLPLARVVGLRFGDTWFALLERDEANFGCMSQPALHAMALCEENFLWKALCKVIRVLLSRFNLANLDVSVTHRLPEVMILN